MLLPNDIQPLLDRYLEGLTSNEEESRLRTFFTEYTGEIPAEWAPFQALFAYEKQARRVHSPAPCSQKNTHFKWFKPLSAAATVAFLIGIAMWLKPNHRNFAVIDGRTITSQAEVKAEAEEALDLIQGGDETPFPALEIMQ